MIAILVPMLGRAQRIEPLLASIRESTSVPCRVVFLCSPGDHEVIDTLDQSGRPFVVVSWECGPGDYAMKMNLGFRLTDEPFLLLGASDILFHPGWDEAALTVAGNSNAGVIGTNDLSNPTVMAGKHSTHSLIRRSYIEEWGTIDEPGKMLHEGYDHQWVDNELIATAQARGQWAFAADSHVEHLHFMWGKSVRDATYDKALSTSREDYALFQRRRRLWK